MFVPCGKCDACRANYQKMWASRLEAEMKHSKFNLFITLTYDNEYLPRVSYDVDEDGICLGNSVRFGLRAMKKYKSLLQKSLFAKRKTTKEKYARLCDEFANTFDDTSYVDGNRYSVAVPPHWVSHYKYNPRTGEKDIPVFDKSQTFAVCSKKDIQDFISNLRTRCSRELGIDKKSFSLRYFICAEYGPDTFRPHYHGTLHTDSFAVAQWLQKDGVFKSWSKQTRNVDVCQLINDKGGCSAYVSKYVTCDTNLPSSLRLSTTRTFHLQSKSPCIGSQCLDLDTLSYQLDKGTLLYSYSFTDKNSRELVTIMRSYPVQSWQRYFPNFCKGSEFSDEVFFDVVKRVYDFARTGEELPNYIELVKNYFDVDNLVQSYTSDETFINVAKRNHEMGWSPIVYEKQRTRVFTEDLQEIRPIDFPFPCQVIRTVHEPSKIMKTSDFVGKCRSCGYGAIAEKIFYSDFDAFLFGIPQNRLACKRIYEVLFELDNYTPKVTNYAKDALNPAVYAVHHAKLGDSPVDKYIYLYRRYKQCQCNDSFRMLEEYGLQHCPTPLSALCHIYPEFVTSLPKYRELLTPDEEIKVSNILYGFDLFLDDIYIPFTEDGYTVYKLGITPFDTVGFSETKKQIRYKNQKKETERVSKYKQFNFN